VCAAEGSLVAAAARLGISRPAVAKRIANLEALAGHALLHRGGRGVRLTDAGATLLAGARRVLDERDAMLLLITELRGDDRSRIGGLRELLGHSPAASRAAQRPEVRLSETERVLELILRASSTAVMICDPDTAVVHEVNDAFCRLTGRSREELLGRPATEGWYEPNEGEHNMIHELHGGGVAKRGVVRIRRPDGTVRVGEATGHLVVLAGAPLLVSTVDDITRSERLETERRAVAASYEALGQLAVDLLSRRPLIESVGRILPELRHSGQFATALVWDAAGARPLIVDGDPPPPGLDRELRRRAPIRPGDVWRLGARDAAAGGISGWAVPLAGAEHLLVVLCGDSSVGFSQEVFADVLSGLGAMVAASAGRRAAN
jgi:PAS domain S-box-containing protein